MNETNKIEYKLEFTSDTDIEKEVIAFLNYKEGGFVYIGIDKDGDVSVLIMLTIVCLKLKIVLKTIFLHQLWDCLILVKNIVAELKLSR